MKTLLAMNYSEQKLSKLELLMDQIDHRKASHIICAAGVVKLLSNTKKFKEARKIEQFGKCHLCVGTYGPFIVMIDKILDEDDIRIFNESGEVLHNLVLEGFEPQDFFV